MVEIEKVLDPSHVQRWWQEMHGHPLPARWMPPSKFYVLLNGEPAAYFGLHGMECSICYLGFPTIDRAVKGENRQRVYAKMCEHAKQWAKENGFEAVFLSIQGNVASSNFRKHGFVYGDKHKGDIKAEHLFMKA